MWSNEMRISERKYEEAVDSLWEKATDKKDRLYELSGKIEALYEMYLDLCDESEIDDDGHIDRLYDAIENLAIDYNPEKNFDESVREYDMKLLYGDD